jgi:hypothetical protein
MRVIITPWPVLNAAIARIAIRAESAQKRLKRRSIGTEWRAFSARVRKRWQRRKLGALLKVRGLQARARAAMRRCKPS